MGETPDTNLPRLHEVHADPSAENSAPALPPALQQADAQKSPARWAYERMIIYIQNFEKQLDGEHEVAMGFAGSEAGVLRIEGMGYFDPDIITFYGMDQTGGRTQLVQHVSQLSVLLRAIPKQDTSAEPNRIGFRLAAELQQDEGSETE
ncbi:MAG: DUF6173 family protein [Paracoccaceae bacterium]